MDVSIIGIDIAKRIFQFHVVDKNGRTCSEEKINARSGINFYGQSAKLFSGYRSM